MKYTKNLFTLLLFQLLVSFFAFSNDKLLLIEEDVMQAMMAFDTLLSKYWTADDVERYVKFFTITIKHKDLNQILIETRTLLLPYLLHESGILKRPSYKAIEEISPIIMQFCQVMKNWEENFSVESYYEPEKYELNHNPYENLLNSHPINKDLFDLANHISANEFDEARIIIEKYTYFYADPVSEENCYINHVVKMMRILYFNTYLKLYNRFGLPRKFSHTLKYQEINEIFKYDPLVPSGFGKFDLNFELEYFNR